MSDETLQSNIEQKLVQATEAQTTIRDLRGEDLDPYMRAAQTFQEAAGHIVQHGEQAIPILRGYVLGRNLLAMSLGAAATRILAMIPSLDSIHILLEAASSPNVYLSQRALLNLKRLPPSSVHVNLLLEYASRMDGMYGEELLLQAILRQDRPEVYPFVEQLLVTHKKELVRTNIVSTLGNIRTPTARRLVRLALNDRSHRVRSTAAFFLILDGEAEHLSNLIAATTSKRAVVREQAILALGRLPRPEGVSLIYEALADNSPKVRKIALLAAAFLGDRRLFGRAVDLLADTKPDVVEQAEAVYRDMTGHTLPISIKEAQALCHEVTLSMEQNTRYYRGVKLALHSLVQLLLSPTAAYFAYANLVAMTGQHLGYDPDEDLVQNIDATQRWISWVSQHGSEYESGNWYYHGRRLDPEQLPAS